MIPNRKIFAFLFDTRKCRGVVLLMPKEELREKLKACFEKCALSRVQLKKCVSTAMKAGLTQGDIIELSKEFASSVSPEDASLCAVAMIG